MYRTLSKELPSLKQGDKQMIVKVAWAIAFASNRMPLHNSLLNSTTRSQSNRQLIDIIAIPIVSMLLRAAKGRPTTAVTRTASQADNSDLLEWRPITMWFHNFRNRHALDRATSKSTRKLNCWNCKDRNKIETARHKYWKATQTLQRFLKKNCKIMLINNWSFRISWRKSRHQDLTRRRYQWLGKVSRHKVRQHRTRIRASLSKSNCSIRVTWYRDNKRMNFWTSRFMFTPRRTGNRRTQTKFRSHPLMTKTLLWSRIVLEKMVSQSVFSDLHSRIVSWTNLYLSVSSSFQIVGVIWTYLSNNLSSIMVRYSWISSLLMEQIQVQQESLDAHLIKPSFKVVIKWTAISKKLAWFQGKLKKQWEHREL